MWGAGDTGWGPARQQGWGDAQDEGWDEDTRAGLSAATGG